MKRSHTTWIIAAVVIVWLASFFVIRALYADPAARGQFGDLFGAVNALFSGLAFAGLIIAISLQRKELSLQRRELQLQREEMEKSRAELASQVEAQRALVSATLAHAKAVEMQLRVEAIKLEASGKAPGWHGEHIGQIRQAADEVSEAIRKVDPKDVA